MAAKDASIQIQWTSSKCASASSFFILLVHPDYILLVDTTYNPGRSSSTQFAGQSLLDTPPTVLYKPKSSEVRISLLLITVSRVVCSGEFFSLILRYA